MVAMKIQKRKHEYNRDTTTKNGNADDNDDRTGSSSSSSSLSQSQVSNSTHPPPHYHHQHVQNNHEVLILKHIKVHDPNRSSHTVMLLDSFVFRHHVCMTFDLFSMNIVEYLRLFQFRGLPKPTVRGIASQILHSLAFLHTQKILHGDLKPENIMLRKPPPVAQIMMHPKALHHPSIQALNTGKPSSNTTGDRQNATPATSTLLHPTSNPHTSSPSPRCCCCRCLSENACDDHHHHLSRTEPIVDIVVIDFGSSCFLQEDDATVLRRPDMPSCFTYLQSRFYRAPEVILGSHVGLPIDMWSFGCLLAELLTGLPVFPGENDAEQMACIMEVRNVPPQSVLSTSTRRKEFFDPSGQPWPHITTNRHGRVRQPGTRTLRQVLVHPDTTTRSYPDEEASSDYLVDFLMKCLAWDATARLTPEEALAHPWIANTRSTPFT